MPTAFGRRSTVDAQQSLSLSFQVPSSQSTSSERSSIHKQTNSSSPHSSPVSSIDSTPSYPPSSLANALKPQSVNLDQPAHSPTCSHSEEEHEALRLKGGCIDFTSCESSNSKERGES